MITRLRAILETVAFTFIVPGTVAVWLPWAIGLTKSSLNRSPAAFISGLLLLSLGAAVYVSSAFSFAWQGRGTPSPTHGTQELVVTGLYKYSRNPMYAGVLAVLVGEFVAFGTTAFGAAIYISAFLIAVNVFILGYEEPTLLEHFGAQYAQYCARVPRWISMRRTRR